MLRGELFATDMVRAYQEGRKLHTARPVPEKIVDAYYDYDDWCNAVMPRDVPCTRAYEKGFFLERAKHRPGDYIYCRETWGTYTKDWEDSDRFLYRADYPDGANGYWHEPEQINWCDLPRWQPSIHMPREASRLFWRVPKVEVMRLEDVTEEFAVADGFTDHDGNSALVWFHVFWQAVYGDARWMWVYWTEPCSREEAMDNGLE